MWGTVCGRAPLLLIFPVGYLLSILWHCPLFLFVVDDRHFPMPGVHHFQHCRHCLNVVMLRTMDDQMPGIECYISIFMSPCWMVSYVRTHTHTHTHTRTHSLTRPTPRSRRLLSKSSRHKTRPREWQYQHGSPVQARPSLIPIPATSHTHTCHVSYPYLPRLIPIPATSHTHTCHVSYPYLPRLISIPATPNTHTCHASYPYLPRLIPIPATSHTHTCHASYPYLPRK